MTSKQRAYLRGLGSTLDPIFQIGKSGITPELCSAVDDALEHRELIKIAVLKNCLFDVRDLSDTRSARTGSDCVQTIGRKFVLYRASKKDPKIVLPK